MRVSVTSLLLLPFFFLHIPSIPPNTQPYTSNPTNSTMAANRTLVNWDDATEKRLLEAILANSVVSSTDWAAVAGHIGDQVTGHACKLVPQGHTRPSASSSSTTSFNIALSNQDHYRKISGNFQNLFCQNFSDNDHDLRVLFQDCNFNIPRPFFLLHLPFLNTLCTQPHIFKSPTTMPRPANGTQFKWDDATEKRLLLAILGHCNTPSNLDWVAIASDVDGHVTASSARSAFSSFCSSHLQHSAFHIPSTLTQTHTFTCPLRKHAIQLGRCC